MQKQSQGATVLEAAIEGAKVRFRSILMTSFAFIAGLIPLILAHGAGAIGNRTIGASALGVCSSELFSEWLLSPACTTSLAA